MIARFLNINYIRNISNYLVLKETRVPDHAKPSIKIQNHK